MWLSLSFVILALAVPDLVSPNPNAANRLACDSNNWWPNGCDDYDNICQITCPHTSDNCEKSPSCGSQPAVPIKYDEMDSAKCEELCTTSRDSTRADEKCRFWRWDLAAGKEKRCTFMSDSQCQHHKECDKPSKCLCGDVGCSKDEKPEDKKNCPSGIDYIAGPAQIHWFCSPDSPSPYNPDTPMPSDTVCYTNQPCSQFSTKTLQVKCDGAGNPSAREGAWIRDPPVDVDDDMTEFYNDAIGAGSDPHPLNEIKCTPTNNDVTLDVPKADMGEISQLSCTTEPTESGEGDNLIYKISAPNTCILMCDFHLGMTIEGRLDRAEGLWAFYITETGEDITGHGEEVKCWPNLD